VAAEVRMDEWMMEKRTQDSQDWRFLYVFVHELKIYIIYDMSGGFYQQKRTSATNILVNRR
jgi:hypothetical protein